MRLHAKVSVSIRSATEDETTKHQELMVQEGNGEMGETDSRKVITFEMILDWNKRWPKDAITGQMAYKGIGFLDIDKKA